MSISVDSRQLETIVQYATFIELLLHPEQAKNILDSIKSANEEYQKNLGLINTKEKADKYLSDAKKTFAQTTTSLETDKSTFSSFVTLKEEELKQRSAELDRISQSLDKKKVEYTSREQNSEKLKAEAEKLFATAKEVDRICSAKQDELTALAIKLNEKQAKLNQILG